MGHLDWDKPKRKVSHFHWDGGSTRKRILDQQQNVPSPEMQISPPLIRVKKKVMMIMFELKWLGSLAESIYQNIRSPYF